MGEKLWGVQYLRGVAALSVLFYHASRRGGLDIVGAGGVDIFFVLSGFLMFHIAASDPEPAAFLSARLRRIVPLYWIATATVVLGQVTGLTRESHFDLERTILSLLFVPSWDPVRHQIYPILVVGWTLNYEMFFYALMAALLCIPRPLRLPTLAAVFAALIVARFVAARPGVLLSFYGDTIILEFAMGAAVAHLWRAGRLPPRGWWLVVSGTVAMVAMPVPTDVSRFVLYGGPAVLMLAGVLAEERYRPVRYLAISALLGDASYSIYLWHLIVVMIVARLLGPSPLMIAVAVVAGIVVGIAAYRLVERPIIAALARGRALVG